MSKYHLMRVLMLCSCLVGIPSYVIAQETLSIAAALNHQVFKPVLDAFQAENPQIDLQYHDDSALAVNSMAHYIYQPPDVVISPAMPWQLALSNDGYAQRLDIPEANDWPSWAKWRNEVFGFTFEPIVMAYRLELATHMPPPSTHRDLLNILRNHRQTLQNKVVTYSPRNSGIGYTLLQQDVHYTPRMWDLVAAMGLTNIQFEDSTKAMLQGLDTGHYWLGYNLLGSYAIVWAQQHPDIIIQIPNDYSLVVMRTAMVHKHSRHPDIAKRFIAFLLSQRGQHIMAGKTPLFSVRPDVIGPYTAQRLRDQVGKHLYPIPMNASLLASVDQLNRADFLSRWDRETAIKKDIVPEMR